MPESVPVIDISRAFSPSLADRHALAREIDQACASIGFLVISGHGVANVLVDDAKRAANAFFDLPLAEKQSCTSGGKGAKRGYRDIGASVLAYSRGEEGAPDHRELFSVGRFDIDMTDDYYACPEGRLTIVPNIWPPSIAGFEGAMWRYFEAMDRLSLVLMRQFALALSLDEHWFDDKVDKHISTLQLSNYPDQKTPPQPGQLRASAHSDWGSLTILKTEDRPGGLEVCSDGGAWRPVPFVPNTFIVNIGDLMARWTDDRWVSTLHRVVNPPEDKAHDSRRLSLVFFHQPNYDAVIRQIRPGAPKYEPITSGDYLRMRIAQTFG
jgi:isopenicillin N synthase-like dioxygenase